ncbi:MAG: hypothetical protein ACRDOI_11560 [Trebonia sp.]
MPHGTLTWEFVTIIPVEARAGGQMGIGYTDGSGPPGRRPSRCPRCPRRPRSPPSPRSSGERPGCPRDADGGRPLVRQR